MAIMASYLDNSQRNSMRTSIGQAPPSPSPAYYQPQQQQNPAAGMTMNMNPAGIMSAPPTPLQTPHTPLSMYNRHSVHGFSNAAPLSAGSNHNLMNTGSNHSSMNIGSNHGKPLGNGSGHVGSTYPNGAPRRVIMRQHHKAASSRAVLMRPPSEQTNFAAPQPNGRRHSLVGFDPMLADNSIPSTPSQTRSSMHEFASAPTIRRTVSPKSGGMVPPAPFSLDLSGHGPRPVTPPQQYQHAPQKKTLTPPLEYPSSRPPKKTQRQHRKGVQSFCVSDLRSISQDAMDEEGGVAAVMGDMQLMGDVQPPAKDMQPPVKVMQPHVKDVQASAKEAGQRQRTPSPKSSSPKTSKIMDFTIKAPKKAPSPKKDVKASSPKKGANSPTGSPKTEGETKNAKKNESAEVTPPRTRKISFLKKGHRRTRSLESKEILPPAKKGIDGENNPRASLPATPASERKQSMYPSIVQDLVDIKFNNLQIPSLAKPSPTSFLTGKEDEVVRTCELEPAPHQMEIPTLPEFVVAARLNEFVENYRRVDQNFDLQQLVGKSRMDLRQIKIPQHIPIAQSLLECGDSVCLQGVISKGTIADDRIECVVFEGQRQFMAVFRGTTEQQTKLNTKTKKKTCPLAKEHPDVEVYQCFLEEYMKLEVETFALLDRLTEENPFCDVVFSGHSFGSAMATLAAFRYSNARPMMRASCLTLASPKVGFSLFRNMVNSQPNLKVMRLEFGQDGKCQLPGTGGSHVGHTLVLHGSLGHNSLKTNQPVLAYKFEVPKVKKFKTTYPDLRSYVTALEELARLNLPWAQDFVGTSGQGVVVNNEARQVV